MDNIIVKIIFIVIVLGGAGGLYTYLNTTTDTIESASDTQIHKILTESDSETADTAE